MFFPEFDVYDDLSYFSDVRKTIYSQNSVKNETFVSILANFDFIVSTRVISLYLFFVSFEEPVIK